jgi:hypothetical protein
MIEVTPIGATYAVTVEVVTANDGKILVFVLNVFNGINAIIFPFNLAQLLE